MFSPDQFTHILPSSIWCITTPRYYFQGTTFIIRNAMGKTLQKVHLSLGQPDLTSYYSWPPDDSKVGYVGLQVSLTQRPTKCQGDLTQYHSWPPDACNGGYVWAQVSLIQRLTAGHADLMSYQSWSLDASKGGTSDCRSTWPKGWPNVKLTLCSTTLGH